MKNLVRRSSAAVGAVCAATAVIVGVTALTTDLGYGDAEQEQDRSSHSPAAISQSTDAAESSRVEKIPGFGRLPADSLRDESIAVWESWRRARETVNCMAAAGFRWSLHSDYPGEPVEFQEIVTALGGYEQGATGPRDGAAENASYAASLETSQRNEYMQALWGESAEDLERADEEGVPNDRGEEFAKGGCKGKAWTEVGSIWTVPNALVPEIDRLRNDGLRASESQAHQHDFAECAAVKGAPEIQEPRDLDESELSTTLLTEISIGCMKHWDQAVSAARRQGLDTLQERHAAELSAQAAKYATALDDMRNDDEFIAWLNSEAARK